MRLFILLLLQLLVFLPITGLAADGGKTTLLKNHKKIEATASQKDAVVRIYGKLPLYFIENRGQVDEKVSFYERGAGHATFFTDKGVVIGLTRSEGRAEKTSHHGNIKDIKAKKDKKAATEAINLSFVGANKEAKIIAGDRKTGHANYFIGNDRSKWRSNIPTFGTVTYKDIYKNIDIKFYGNNRHLEHDVIIRPGGDISRLRFAYNGARGLKVTEDGDLEVTLTHGKIMEQEPLIYQEINGERVAVDGSYRIFKSKNDGSFTYGFDVASYDHTKKIIIDPVLVYSTYLGGSDVDVGRGIALDNTGAAYVTGITISTDFPLFSPIQGTCAGPPCNDVFITKINTAGTAIVYSTYLGGSSADVGASIAVDTSGAAYVTGSTNSPDFPLMNPVQATSGGFFDAFVTKLNSAGTALVYSTYLGGSGSEQCNGIAVDSSGHAYVTGFTPSTDFPLKNPLQATYGGGANEAFITKLDLTGQALVYSTYIGGSGSDISWNIALDASGAVYVTGTTFSTDFPLKHPIQASLAGGGTDAFVTKIDAAGLSYVYSTYLGGNGGDTGISIAVDSVGAAYITGSTSSTDFPLMTPIQGTSGGFAEAFVTKLNPSGTALTYSTYLGGSSADIGSSIAVDSAGAAYVTGNTASPDFPLASPIQVTYGGGISDGMILKINPAGSALVYSTYLGGSLDDLGQGIAVDAAGNAYVAGQTLSTDFPLANPIQGTLGGGTLDAFVAKIGGTPPPPPPPVVTLALLPDATTVAQGFTLGYNVTVTNTTAVQQCFQYWENVNLPGGVLFPAKDSIFKPVPRLCLNGGASKTVHLTHGVPLTAPTGAYVFNSYVGIFPFNFRDVVDTASFNFNVTPGVAPIPNPLTSWRLIENGFRR